MKVRILPLLLGIAYIIYWVNFGNLVAELLIPLAVILLSFNKSKEEKKK